MAKFQERVYHDDATEKHILTVEDILFLTELQKELNTQPNMGNADPLYWGIAQTRETPASPDYADTVAAANTDGAIVARDLKELAEYLDESNIDGVSGCQYFNKSCTIKFSDGDTVSAYSVSDLIEILHNAGITNLTAQPMSRGTQIVTDALFITHKDCEEHLEQYGYNYEQDAHAYAMTAIRSPRYEKLIRILRTVDWSKLTISGTI